MDETLTNISISFFGLGLFFITFSDNEDFLLWTGVVFLGIGLIFAIIAGLVQGFNRREAGSDIFSSNERGKRERRLQALEKAAMYLLPYEDIWINLTLSNKFCTLKLRGDGKTIEGTEKKSEPNVPYRKFRIIKSAVHPTEEIWNMFCKVFSFQTSYDGLKESCRIFGVSIYEDIITPQGTNTKSPAAQKAYAETQTKYAEVQKTDVNNCSEIDLTALPGISIVISKKIIKKREEIGGFKSVGEFLDFVNLKPNITNKLRSLICVKKMEGSLKIERFIERTVDL